MGVPVRQAPTLSGSVVLCVPDQVLAAWKTETLRELCSRAGTGAVWRGADPEPNPPAAVGGQQADINDMQEKAPAGASHRYLFRHGGLNMKTPTVDDPKPKRENLGPTGPAKVSHDEEDKDVRPTGGPSYESELEHILDKRPKTPPD